MSTSQVQKSSSSLRSHSHKAQSRDLNGRTFTKHEKKELCCLKKMWEAIKNFFANLFGCCCPCLKKESASKKHVLSKKNISANQPKHKSHSQTLPTPGSPQPGGPQPQNQSPNPLLAQQAPQTPPQPAAVASQPAQSISASQHQPLVTPKPQEPEKPKVPLFVPLQALKDKRLNISYIPTLPKREATPLTKPESFPYCDQLANTLNEPKLPILRAAVDKFRETSAQQLTDYVAQLIDGYCPSISPKKEADNAIKHPSQLTLIFDFCKKRIGQINKLLAEAEKEEINTEEFFKQFATLQNVAGIWQTLWKIAQKSDLKLEDCDALWKAAQQLPDSSSDFFTHYPEIKERLKELAVEIKKKLVVAEKPANLLQMFFTLGSKLGMDFSLKTANSILKDHANHFFYQLADDLQELFKIPQETDQNKNHSLEPIHIKQILNYYAEEIRSFNAAVTQFQKENSDLQWNYQLLDPATERKKVAALIQPLVKAWVLLKDMLQEKNVDKKINQLNQAADLLPDRDSPLWQRFPIFKELISTEMLPLTFGFFSTHKFVVINPTDQQRVALINTAFEKLRAKLGIGIDKKIEILKEAANFLPDMDHDPALKEALATQWLPLIFDNFAAYPFETGHTNDDAANVGSPYLRREAINTAFAMMAAKLGCEPLTLGQSGENGIDRKIELLKKMADSLPGKDSNIWTAQPKLKEFIAKAMMPLAFESFGVHAFEVIRNAQNAVSFDADKERRKAINVAFKVMAEKLGCEQLQIKNIEIVMDTEEDERIKQEAAAQELILRASQLQNLYLQVYQQNAQDLGQQNAQTFAAEQVAERMKNDTAGHKDQKTLLLNLLTCMRSQPIANHIKLFLADFVFD